MNNYNRAVTKCRLCGGEVKVVAAIEERVAITKILGHLGLETEPPVPFPPRAPPEESAESDSQQFYFDLHAHPEEHS